ncbi:MAG: HEAT repeat domain-containing protein [Planctomycetota bacterium]
MAAISTSLNQSSEALSIPASRAARLLVAAWLAVVGAGAGGGAFGEEPTPAKIDALLNDMAVRASGFPPENLLAFGPEGLAAVFDQILPETAEEQALGDMAEMHRPLIEQLGAESFQVREAATEQLRALGRSAYAAVKRATASTDPEISWRAVRILRDWEMQNARDPSRYVPALMQFFRRMDDSRYYEIITERMLKTLSERAVDGGRQNLVRECIRTLASADDPKYLLRLQPIIETGPTQSAELLLQSIAMAPGERECPQLVLDALESKRDDVAIAAVDALTRFYRSDRSEELRQRLTKVFENGANKVKFRAARPLIQTFDDERAWEFTIQLAKESTDRNEQYQAIQLLGERPSRDEAPKPKVLEAFRELIAAEDVNVRHMALSVLGRFKGEDVVALLISALGDENSNVGTEAGRRLMQQSDKKELRRMLTEASEHHDNTKVRTQAKKLLESLPAE